MTPSPPRRKIRVLCLHSFRTNAKVIETQTQVLQNALGSDAEFVFVDGGSSSSSGGGGSDAVKNSELNSAAEVVKLREVMDPHSEWNLSYAGIKDSIAFIDEKLSMVGPFDAVVGFSQGAILLTILSALYLQKHNVRLWKLVICVGGFRIMDPQFRHLFETSETGEAISVPFSSVHIIGKKDPIYHESHKLVKMYEDYPNTTPASIRKKIVYEHSEGHKFPSLKGNEAFYEELVRVIHDHCSDDFTIDQSDNSQASKL